MATVNVTTANTFEQWRVKTNEIGTAIGNTAEVTVSDIGATSIVAALKAHQGIVVGSVTVAGSTMTGNLVFNDNTKVILGTSSDGLEIYHDGTNSYIADTGTGDLKVTAAQVDFSGNVDVDGTLEADVITVNGATLDETIQDSIGTMLSGNTEEGITVTYDDTDNEIDFALSATQTTITSLKNAALVIGRDADNDIDFATDNNIIFRANGADQVKLLDGILQPITDSDIDLGTTGVRFKDAFVDTITVTGEIDGASLDISGNADIDGTLEADAITVNGVALTSHIQTLVGAMVSSNSESGIEVDYQPGDATIDFNVSDPTITLTGDITGAGTITNLNSVSIVTTRAAGSTSTDDIADNAITNAKMADNAINTTEILDDAVTTAKIINDAVSRAKLKDEVVLTITNSAGSVVKTMYGAGS
jgi:cytoskeletal protein CcmA (bactofilin family)